MSFHSSAWDIELVDYHFLKANLSDADGETHEAIFDLNEVIGNNNGEFYWDGENFSDSASDIEFNLEEGEPILRAKLGNLEGEQIDGVINLAERIGNDNGSFQYV